MKVLPIPTGRNVTLTPKVIWQLFDFSQTLNLENSVRKISLGQIQNLATSHFVYAVMIWVVVRSELTRFAEDNAHFIDFSHITHKIRDCFANLA